MFDVNSSNLTDVSGELASVADDLDTASRRRTGDRRTIRGAVEEGIDEELRRDVVQLARRRAREHVEGYAEDIEVAPGSWRGRSYETGLVADNEVVLAHEFGTGIYGDEGRYRIPARDDGDPVAFQVGGETVVVEYVMHPGVDEEAFIRESMEDGADNTLENAADEVLERFRDAFTQR